MFFEVGEQTWLPSYLGKSSHRSFLQTPSNTQQFSSIHSSHPQRDMTDFAPCHIAASFSLKLVPWKHGICTPAMLTSSCCLLNWYFSWLSKPKGMELRGSRRPLGSSDSATWKLTFSWLHRGWQRFHWRPGNVRQWIYMKCPFQLKAYILCSITIITEKM